MQQRHILKDDVLRDKQLDMFNEINVLVRECETARLKLSVSSFRSAFLIYLEGKDWFTNAEVQRFVLDNQDEVMINGFEYRAITVRLSAALTRAEFYFSPSFAKAASEVRSAAIEDPRINHYDEDIHAKIKESGVGG